MDVAVDYLLHARFWVGLCTHDHHGIRTLPQAHAGSPRKPHKFV